jgi:hypothetical protein
MAYDFVRGKIRPSNFGVQVSNLSIAGMSGTQLNLEVDVAIDNGTSAEVSISNLDVILYHRQIKNGSVTWSRLGRSKASDRVIPIKANNRSRVKNLKVTVDLFQSVLPVTQIIRDWSNKGAIGQTFRTTAHATVAGQDLTKTRDFKI